ncbi:Speckle-type POZ protein like [Argiope bruennichi]|uniref:Speckle-type POZ protein like n=1 Tax=Argiope bruennichi TaxID=94029 RepID=A0A8T0EEJ5_ARGBR|nr:Speckle-type POZ protein like [Argiope bruennichi]
MEKHAYVFRWIIENSPYCWHKKGFWFDSPVFTVNSMGKSRWRLRFYPRGNKNVTDFSPVYLRRENNDDGPENVILSFDISYLAENGSPIRTQKIEEHCFPRSHGYGIEEILTREELFRNKKVILCCKMWNIEGTSSEGGYTSVTTKIGKASNSFVWDIKDFLNLTPDEERMTVIKSASTDIQQLSLKFFVMEGLGCEENLCVKATSSNEKIRIRDFKLFIMDATGGKIKCNLGEHAICTINTLYHFPMIFSKRQLMQKKNQYLSDNTLRLFCELSYSTGIILEEFNSKDTCLNELKPFEGDLSPSERHIPNALSGLDCLYHHQIMCDVRLRTETEAFPCHRIILSAASPVFRSMFTNPMKEEASEFVDIPDLEDGIVQRMLPYLYTGTLEDLDWESASKLYAAADKYQIIPLKDKCVSFLKTNISVANACEALVLADFHQDNELKRDIQNFILDNSSNIISSNNWSKLMGKNIELAAETMHLKWLNE